MNKIEKGKKIAVAMSGGVDSSTVAYLLKNQGYEIFGVTMRTFSEEDRDAKQICDDLGIEHHVLDVRDEFSREVIDYFVNEYMNGRTPNPCMMCNKKIKFGKLLDFAEKMGADYLATGHYANIENGTLVIGEDTKKDQVYFLSQSPKERLKKIVFPIGKMEKTELRKLAFELGVKVHNKKDSQEICFVEDGKLKEFITKWTGGKARKKGKIIDRKGNILGEHLGLSFYTIGQRKGLGIAAQRPLYVLELNKKNNTVIVGEKEELESKKLIANQLNLFMFDEISKLEALECYVKTRFKDSLHRGKIKVLDSKMIEIEFDEKIRAITPGQGAVLYTKDGRVIGSSFIVRGE